MSAWFPRRARVVLTYKAEGGSTCEVFAPGNPTPAQAQQFALATMVAYVEVALGLPDHAIVRLVERTREPRPMG